MAAKDISWAFIAEDGTYKGGMVLPEGEEPSKGNIPADSTPTIVKRFPQYYEIWDHKSRSWKGDLKEKHKTDALVEAMEGRRKGELDIPSEQTQRWVYALLHRLFPDLNIPDEVMAEYFPFIPHDNKPQGVKRSTKLGKPKP